MHYASKPGQEVLGGVTDRQVAGLRLFLSIAALLAIYVDPAEPDRFVHLTYGTLIAYTLYSACIYYIARGVESFSRKMNTFLVWADILIYTALISFSSGTNSIFFFFYFFVIATACSRLGSESGTAVTFVSTLAFLSVAYLSMPQLPEWNRLLLRPASLGVMGYVLTFWAKAELGLRQKLDLLREVSQTSNPRFGVERTSTQLLKRLLVFFKADSAVLLEYLSESDSYLLRCVTESGANAITAPDELRNILKAVSRNGASLYTESRGIFNPRPSHRMWNPESQEIESKPLDEALPVVEWLGGRAFILVPMRHYEWFRGYLALTSDSPSTFRIEDAKFLVQLANQVTTVRENIRLVDRMASDAAEEERRRVARSVHDRVVQPYIGLHMGLVGIRQLVESVEQASDLPSRRVEKHQALNALDDLVRMARDGIDELRHYAYGLRNPKARANSLVEALLRYAARFESVTGIRVLIKHNLEAGDINDRLAAEIFEMTTEALSNVQRHTTATSVNLVVGSGVNGTLAIHIENETAGETTARSFIPKSITERSLSLGGQTRVCNEKGRTVVQIEIPL
jgi:signal transduction histidine kinase